MRLRVPLLRLVEVLSLPDAPSPKMLLSSPLPDAPLPPQAVEDWLYDEGEDVTKSVYIAKLEELKKTGGPIELRFEEDQTRGPAADALRQAAESYMAFARSDSLAHAHIEAADRHTMIQESEAALKWLGE